MSETTETTDPGTETPSGPFNRRNFLFGGSAVAVATVLAACGSDDSNGNGAATTTTGDGATTTTGGGGGGMDDVAIANIAASLEVLAVNTYQAAIDAATAGDLGDVPPAVVEFATTVQGHHQAHLDAWNGVITGEGGQAVTEPPAELEAGINAAFGRVNSVAALAQLAEELEQTAADTYFAVIPMLESKAAVTLASTIQPIDMQHVAVLRFVQGEYPVPDTFANTEAAFTG